MGASMRLEEEGGARAPAGDMAGGVAAPLLGALPLRLSEGASEPALAVEGTAEGLEGVEARLAGRGTTAGAAQVREATRGTSGAATWMCTGAPRAWPGLFGEAGGGVEPGTDTM